MTGAAGTVVSAGASVDVVVDSGGDVAGGSFSLAAPPPPLHAVTANATAANAAFHSFAINAP